MDLSQYSDEELMKMHDSLDQPAAEETSAPENMSDLSHLSDEELNHLNDKMSIDAPEAAARGFAQSVTLGHSDEMVGAFNAAKQFISSDYDPATTAAVYTKSRDEQRDLNKYAQESSPVAYGAGMLAPALIPGAAFLNSLRGAVATGVLSGEGFSDANNASEIATDAATGGVLGAGAHGLGSLIGSAFPSKQALVADAQKQKSLNVVKAIGVSGEADMKKLLTNVELSGQDLDTFANDIWSVIPDAVKSPEEVKQALKVGRDTLWNGTIKPLHDQIDLETMGQTVNVAEFGAKLKRELKNALPLKGAADIESVSSGIMEDVEIMASGRPTVSLTDIDNFKNDISKRFKRSDIDEIGEIKNTVLSTATNAQKDSVKSALGADAQTQQIYGDSMRKYLNIAETKSFSDNAYAKHMNDLATFGPETTSVVKNIRTAINLARGRGVLSSVSTIVGKALKEPSTSHYISNANKYSSLISSLENNPSRYEKYAAQISKAALIGVGPAVSALGYADSVIKLQNNPIPSTMQGVKQNGVHVLNVLQNEAPQLYTPMKEALDNDDEGTIGGIISNLRALPQAAAYFDHEIGLDGKLYSDIDKHKAKTLTESCGFSNSQRCQAYKLINQGIVPNFNTPPKPPTISQRVITQRTSNGQKVEKF